MNSRDNKVFVIVQKWNGALVAFKHILKAMFEKITLRRSINGPALTIGEVAEALLFYQNVHLILNLGNISSLVSSIGTNRFLALLNRPGVSAVYCEDNLGTHTQTSIPFDVHTFATFRIMGHQDKGALNNKRKRLQHIIENCGATSKEAKKFAEIFLEKVPHKSVNSDYFVKGGIAKAAYNDLDDSSYIHEAVRTVLAKRLNKPVGPFDFRIIKTLENGFYVVTNLNYSKINFGLGENESQERVTEGSIVNEVLEARSDFILASHYGSEFYTSETTSELIKIKCASLFRRLEIESEEKTKFTEIVTDGKSIREALDAKEKSFDDFLDLLHEADKFKDWLNNVKPDESIIKEYLESVSKKGWLETLPGKALRYVISTGVGFYNPAAGLTASAVDNFLLDKIRLGWRPSYFVNGKIKNFLSVD